MGRVTLVTKGAELGKDWPFLKRVQLLGTSCDVRCPYLVALPWGRPILGSCSPEMEPPGSPDATEPSPHKLGQRPAPWWAKLPSSSGLPCLKDTLTTHQQPKHWCGSKVDICFSNHQGELE